MHVSTFAPAPMLGLLLSLSFLHQANASEDLVDKKMPVRIQVGIYSEPDCKGKEQILRISAAEHWCWIDVSKTGLGASYRTIHALKRHC